jgi:hypothetical protein
MNRVRGRIKRANQGRKQGSVVRADGKTGKQGEIGRKAGNRQKPEDRKCAEEWKGRAPDRVECR